MPKKRYQDIPLDSDIKDMSRHEAHALYNDDEGHKKEFDELIAQRDAIQRKLVRLKVRHNMLLARAAGHDTVTVDRDELPALEEDKAA